MLTTTPRSRHCYAIASLTGCQDLSAEDLCSLLKGLLPLGWVTPPLVHIHAAATRTDAGVRAPVLCSTVEIVLLGRLQRTERQWRQGISTACATCSLRIVHTQLHCGEECVDRLIWLRRTAGCEPTEDLLNAFRLLSKGCLHQLDNRPMRMCAAAMRRTRLQLVVQDALLATTFDAYTDMLERDPGADTLTIMEQIGHFARTAGGLASILQNQRLALLIKRVC